MKKISQPSHYVLWLVSLMFSLLTACVFANEAQNIRFLDVSISDLEGPKFVRAESQVWADIYGICPLSKDVVLLFGNIDVRSLVLRSADSGGHWREVAYPVSGSTVLFMDFINDRFGWALVLEGIEGPEDIVLFHTRDGGQTWDRLGVIENSYRSVPEEMNFVDEMNGQIVRSFDMDWYSFLKTTDGGATWQEESITPYKQYQPKPREPFCTSSDGSQWQYEIVGEDIHSRKIVVSRRLKEGDPWQVRSVLPEKFELIDGRVIAY